jgi:hypothetical protein
MIEIAPNVFVNQWSDVVNGYVHGCGHFIINLSNGQTIHVSDKADIETTIKYWKADGQPIADMPVNPPKDIELWLPYAKQRTTGKTVF